MQKQMVAYIEKFLSPYLCGYRKGFNAQYALLAMIEKWKKCLDGNGFAGAILMDLSKAFDTRPYSLVTFNLIVFQFMISFRTREMALMLIYDIMIHASVTTDHQKC